MSPITPAQRRKIFRQAKKLGLDDDARRSLQEAIVGKASLTRFTREDARRLIDDLNEKGAKEKRSPVRPRPKGPRPLPDNVILFITPKQRTKIEVMAGQVVWREEGGFEKWMLSKFKFRYPRTNHEVDMVIHGLDSLRAQQKKKRLEGEPVCG